MYHSSAFARERDKIRQAVLQDLGWQIVRICSTDWWTNKAGALSKLDGALSKVLESTPLETSEQRTNGTPDDRVTSGPDEGDELEASIDSATDAEASQPEVKTRAPSDSPPESDKAPQERPSRVDGGSAPYPAFEGSAGPDPRNASAAQVADGLFGIIRVEEPMLVKRAYDIYLRACGIRRMGRNLKRRMNRALQHALRRGLVETEDEWSVGGSVRIIVRSRYSPPVIARQRGPRRFDEIPPSELQLVARQVRLGREDELEFDSDEHLRAVLKAFQLQRLTTRIGTTLHDVLERPYPYVDAALE